MQGKEIENTQDMAKSLENALKKRISSGERILGATINDNEYEIHSDKKETEDVLGRD